MDGHDAAASGVAAVDLAADDPIIEWVEADAPALDGSRQFEPSDEFDLRGRRVSRLGLWMLLAFLAPILGAPDSPLAFPQFAALIRWSSVSLVVLLPAVAGIVVWIGGRCFDAPLRGGLALGSGLSFVALVLGFDGIRQFLSASVTSVPSSLQLSTVLQMCGVWGLFAASRVRWYRPLRRSAWLVACGAAACWAGYLLLPVGGMLPITMPFRAFGDGIVLGLAMTAHFGLLTAAAIVSVRNTLATPAWNAARRAGFAFTLLVTAAVVPLVLLVLYALSFLGGLGQHSSAGLLVLTTAAKFGVTYGTLLLLVPVGIADLWIGPSEQRAPVVAAGDDPV